MLAKYFLYSRQQEKRSCFLSPLFHRSEGCARRHSGCLLRTEKFWKPVPSPAFGEGESAYKQALVPKAAISSRPKPEPGAVAPPPSSHKILLLLLLPPGKKKKAELPRSWEAKRSHFQGQTPSRPNPTPPHVPRACAPQGARTASHTRARQVRR